MVREGKAPPDDNREFYKKKGFIYLTNRWQELMVTIWLNSRVANGFGVMIDVTTVLLYIEEYKLNKIETLETIKLIERSVTGEKDE